MNEKVKAIFFAQYLGQDIDFSETEYYKIDGHRLTSVKLRGLRVDPEYDPLLFIKTNLDAHNNGNLWLNPEVCKIVLRSINDLTDTEASTLLGIAFYHPDIENYDPKECGSGDGDYNNDGSWWIEASCRCWDGELHVNPMLSFTLVGDDEKTDPVYNQIGCIDYLRSIGIALPFTFLNDQNQPETYSVEKLVEMGWVMIETNN